EVRPEYERNSPRMSSNSYVNLKIATCLVRYADDRLIDQRFLSVYWTVYSYLALTRHIAHSDFELRAFDIDDGAIVCRKDFFEILDVTYAERSPFVKWHSWIVMAFAPFFLVLSRLLSMYFGTGGVLFFIAAITFPASLWLIGVMIRVAVTMIQLPRAMEQKCRRPVLMGDASF
ncbi:hypothetical protein KTD27_29110, partial [Burkholderia multivorans]|nr:hypothetical protein [Burkholderia multivorans]